MLIKEAKIQLAMSVGKEATSMIKKSLQRALTWYQSKIIGEDLISILTATQRNTMLILLIREEVIAYQF